ncbi:hypothetical protein XSR1_40012 [Xenorhabdus szentirmaii DSM 16338]|uniref:Uncharacterized protein n=1 Tax=Xenorhabdus szentirmaii DSM 16338 TaxID=1427518 RepID=W1J1P0_9GAMM|nr:hypothetical protein XSR1_40012 [Xenorhabdus szentirmaii DSM 16338]
MKKQLFSSALLLFFHRDQSILLYVQPEGCTTGNRHR